MNPHWRRKWQPSPVFLPRVPLTEEPGGLLAISLQSQTWLKRLSSSSSSMKPHVMRKCFMGNSPSDTRLIEKPCVKAYRFFPLKELNHFQMETMYIRKTEIFIRHTTQTSPRFFLTFLSYPFASFFSSKQ